MKKKHWLNLLIVLLAGLSSCQKSGVRIYEIPKETEAESPFSVQAPQSESSASPPAPRPVVSSNASEISWTVPEGWKEAALKPMRLASYASANGQVDISVVKLGGAAGGVASNVNRWRGQVGLEPSSPESIAKAATSFESEGLKGSLFVLYGAENGTLAAIVPYQGMSWFFKATGPSSSLKEEASRFNEWVESLRVP